MSDNDFEIDVKLNRVQQPHFKEKKKTEICLNYLYKGKCKFSENCSFAHGDRELRKKLNNQNFKTKPCKNYHKFGGCPYGSRCQYLHSEIKDKIKWWGYLQKQFKKQRIPYTFPWEKSENEKIVTSTRMDILRFQKVGVTCFIQLPVFQRICD